MTEERIFERKLSVSKALLEEMKELEAAALYESMNKQGAMTGEIQALVPGQKICGYALTVRVPLGDNLMIHKAINMARSDDVIVIESAMPNDVSMIGSLMVLQAKMNGAAGFVMDGKIVDVDVISEIGLPVFCSGKAIRGVTKRELGWINCPINVGGVVVQAGDIVVGDSDGVVVVPASLAEDAAQKARARMNEELLIAERIKNGEDLYEIKRFKQAFEELYAE